MLCVSTCWAPTSVPNMLGPQHFKLVNVLISFLFFLLFSPNFEASNSRVSHSYRRMPGQFVYICIDGKVLLANQLRTLCSL